MKGVSLLFSFCFYLVFVAKVRVALATSSAEEERGLKKEKEKENERVKRFFGGYLWNHLTDNLGDLNIKEPVKTLLQSLGQHFLNPDDQSHDNSIDQHLANVFATTAGTQHPAEQPFRPFRPFRSSNGSAAQPVKQVVDAVKRGGNPLNAFRHLQSVVNAFTRSVEEEGNGIGTDSEDGGSLVKLEARRLAATAFGNSARNVTLRRQYTTGIGCGCTCGISPAVINPALHSSFYPSVHSSAYQLGKRRVNLDRKEDRNHEKVGSPSGAGGGGGGIGGRGRGKTTLNQKREMNHLDGKDNDTFHEKSAILDLKVRLWRNHVGEKKKKEEREKSKEKMDEEKEEEKGGDITKRDPDDRNGERIKFAIKRFVKETREDTMKQRERLRRRRSSKKGAKYLPKRRQRDAGEDASRPIPMRHVLHSIQQPWHAMPPQQPMLQAVRIQANLGLGCICSCDHPLTSMTSGPSSTSSMTSGSSSTSSMTSGSSSANAAGQHYGQQQQSGQEQDGQQQSVCGQDEFACKNGDCVDSSWRCDGDRDCEDGEDEDGCGGRYEEEEEEEEEEGGGEAEEGFANDGEASSTCAAADEFPCHNGFCISDSWRCDGEGDCLDDEDEAGCGVNYGGGGGILGGSDIGGSGGGISGVGVIGGITGISGGSSSGISGGTSGGFSEGSHSNGISGSSSGGVGGSSSSVSGSGGGTSEPGIHHGSGVSGGGISGSDGANNYDDLPAPPSPSPPPPSPPISRCNPETHFDCKDGLRCVRWSKRCDGEADCGNGEDENDCFRGPSRPPPAVEEETTCNPDDQFQCRTGDCIRLTWKCDGMGDCPEEDDEDGCESAEMMVGDQATEDASEEAGIMEAENDAEDAAEAEDSAEADTDIPWGILDYLDQVASSAGNECPRGWIPGPSGIKSCYFIPSSPQTKNFGSYWRNEDKCKRENSGSNLVSVESEREQRFLETLLAEFGVSEWDYWTNGYKGGDGSWHWGRRNNSIHEDGYSNWDTVQGQPNNSKHENCIFIGHKSSFNHKWHDFSCFYRCSYICELETSLMGPQ